MGWLFAIFVVGLVMYWLSKLGEKALSTKSTPQRAEGALRESLEGAPCQDDFEVTVSHQETPSGAIDLREDAERLLRIVGSRSEEHTSELQSRGHLVCRLLLE